MTATATATGLIYWAAGSPPRVRDEYGVCRTCGWRGTGMNFYQWVPDDFNGWDLLRQGTVICEACQFCFEGRMRECSHFVTGGRWIQVPKNDRRRMVEPLMGSPDLAVIAESGKEHIIWRAHLGWWQFERAGLLQQPARLRTMLNVAEQLYAGGFSKREIATGEYSQQRILAFGPWEWRGLENDVQRWRGSVLLSLALFLAEPVGSETKPPVSETRPVLGETMVAEARA